MLLDLSSLEHAVHAYEALIMEAEQPGVMDALSETLQDGIRSGVIQHFEFTYELCWKMIRRWLETNAGRSAVLGITHRELYRYAAEYRLIDDAATWWEFHLHRNLTSHTYDEQTAGEVYETALRFLPHAKDVYARLAARND